MATETNKPAAVEETKTRTLDYGLQDILRITETSRREVEKHLDRSHEGFHPEETSIYAGLGREDRSRICETLNALTLRQLVEKLGLKEYFGPSTTLATGSSGAQGASYVIPDKIYADLFESGRSMDLTPLISNVLPAAQGLTVKANAETKDGFKAKFGSSGGEAPNETIAITQGTITPRQFQVNAAITNDMIEDSQFELMEKHLDIAGKEMGDFSTKMCLFPVMDDHRGTTTTYRVTGAYNTVSAGGTYFYTSDFIEAVEANFLDGFASDVVVLPPSNGLTFLKGEGAGTPIPSLDALAALNVTQQHVGTWAGVPFYMHINDATTLAPTAVSYYSGLYTTTWHSLVLNKKYGIQTVRKRWLKIEKYSDPIKDLAGAVISARQGHLVARADAVCVVSQA